MAHQQPELSWTSHAAEQLRPLFPLGLLKSEEGLVARLTVVLGSEGNARITLGDLLHGHRCGRYGVISQSDRDLNEYLLREARLSARGHIVSLHPVGPLWVRISTDLQAGGTSLRFDGGPQDGE